MKKIPKVNPAVIINVTPLYNKFLSVMYDKIMEYAISSKALAII